MRRDQQGRPCCHRNGALDLKRELQEHFKDNTTITIKPGLCMGHCNQGPNIRCTYQQKELILNEGTLKKITDTIEKLCQA